MRLFAAIEIDETIRRRLGSVKDNFPGVRGIKWVEPENMHLTLRFFGEWPEERTAELIGSLEQIDRPAAFVMRVSGLRFLPSDRFPRVFTAVAEVPEELLAFQKKIEQQARALGFPPEKRPFAPHITIGRIREPKAARRLAHEVRALSTEGWDGSPAKGLTLFQSKLTPQGPIYTALAEFPFTQDPDAPRQPRQMERLQ